MATRNNFSKLHCERHRAIFQLFFPPWDVLYQHQHHCSNSLLKKKITRVLLRSRAGESASHFPLARGKSQKRCECDGTERRPRGASLMAQRTAPHNLITSEIFHCSLDSGGGEFQPCLRPGDSIYYIVNLQNWMGRHLIAGFKLN